MAEELRLSPAEGLTVAWDRAAVAALAKPDDGGTPWRLEGALEPRFSALRVISGATEEGAVLVLCAARPAGAANHDEELVAALVVSPEDERHEIEEALVSTEYTADGSIRRLGLELYREGDDYPVRGAGDVKSAAPAADEGGRDVAELDFRLDGSAGTARYEILHAA